MYQNMTHTYCFLPWKFWVQLFELRAYHICCFAYYLDIFQRGKISKFVRHERIKVISLNKLRNILPRFYYVFQSSFISTRLSHTLTLYHYQHSF